MSKPTPQPVQSTSTKRVLVSGPSITQKEIDYVTDAVTNAWFDNGNVYHQRFEAAFAEYVGRKFAIALPSCTSAIHLSLLALGVGPGDEVVLPDLTWIASAAPVNYVGATPVFVDVNPKTWCMSPESFRDCITPRTKAVIPVDLYGAMPDMNAIIEVARDHGIAVIEDSAEAIGSAYEGRKAGSFGDASVFSFHGSKTLTTGEGGMLLTDSDELNRQCLFLRDHGRKPGDRMFWNSEVAYKYKMSSMQAALGLAQLERVSELIEKKRQLFAWYRSELAELECVTLNQQLPGSDCIYWMVTAVVNPNLNLRKEELMTRLEQRNIDTRPFFYPLSSLPAYEGLAGAAEARERNEVSYKISPYGINLPSGLQLTSDDVRYTCDVLKEEIRACTQS